MGKVPSNTVKETESTKNLKDETNVSSKAFEFQRFFFVPKQ